MTETFDFNAFSEKFKDLATKNPIAFTEEYHKQYELWELQQKKKKQEEAQTKPSPASKLLNNIVQPKTEIVVGNTTFVHVHWSPTQCQKKLPKIGKFFIAPMSMVMSGEQTEDKRLDLASSLPAALTYLFNILEEDDIMDLYRHILDTTYYVDKEDNGLYLIMDNFDAAFADNVFGVFNVVSEVLRLNVVDPFIRSNGSQSLLNLAGNVMPLTELAKL